MRDYKWSEFKKICKKQEKCLDYDYWGRPVLVCPLSEECLDICNFIIAKHKKSGEENKENNNEND